MQRRCVGAAAPQRAEPGEAAARTGAVDVGASASRRSSSGSSLPASRSARPPVSMRRARTAPSAVTDDRRRAPPATTPARASSAWTRAAVVGETPSERASSRTLGTGAPGRERATRDRPQEQLEDVEIARHAAGIVRCRAHLCRYREEHMRSAICAAAMVLALAGCGGGDESSLVLATTTSTQDSGLLDELVPAFEEESGLEVKTIAVGSGEAIELGERGEADVAARALAGGRAGADGHRQGRRPAARHAQRLRRRRAGGRSRRHQGHAARRGVRRDRRARRRPSSRAATTRGRTAPSWRSGRRAGSSPPATGTSRPARGWARRCAWPTSAAATRSPTAGPT